LHTCPGCDVDTLQQRFGSIIRSRRTRIGLGQEALADKAHLHRTNVSLLERGKRMPTFAAAAFGYVTFRRRIKGVYFALITQALVPAAFTFVVNQQPYTGGVVGMNNLAKLSLFGQRFTGPALFYLTTAVLAAAFLACLGLVRSKFGKILTAIRDSEYRVLALGYDTAVYKTFIFALAGGLAGLAGALYVAGLGTTGPDTLSIVFSIQVVVLVAVGSRGTLIGAVLGVVLVSFAETYINDNYNEVFRKYLHGEGWPLLMGGLFVLVVGFLPEGLLGGFTKGVARLKQIASGRTRPAAGGEPDMDPRPKITSDEILKVENLTVAFGEFKALDDLTFSVARGELRERSTPRIGRRLKNEE
jgi:urea ABC transporter permease protein UrtC